MESRKHIVARTKCWEFDEHRQRFHSLRRGGLTFLSSRKIETLMKITVGNWMKDLTRAHSDIEMLRLTDPNMIMMIINVEKWVWFIQAATFTSSRYSSYSTFHSKAQLFLFGSSRLSLARDVFARNAKLKLFTLFLFRSSSDYFVLSLRLNS